MKILVLSLIVSAGLLFLLYRALCAWTQNSMRNAMFEEGQVPGKTPMTNSAPTNHPHTSLQDRDNTASPF